MQHPDRDSPRRKATLFCPTCEHESPLAAHWREVTTVTTRMLICPICNELIDCRTSHDLRSPAAPDD